MGLKILNLLCKYKLVLGMCVFFALYIVLHALDLLCLQLDAFVPLTANCYVGFLPIIRYWGYKAVKSCAYSTNLGPLLFFYSAASPDGCWHCRSQSDSFQLAEPSGNIPI